jgi:hypothetical protein
VTVQEREKGRPFLEWRKEKRRPGSKLSWSL